MRAPVVRRHHLDVERVIATVEVYSMRASGNCTWPRSSHGKSCPCAQLADLQRIATGRPSASSRFRFALLQELLVLRLQLVLEDDPLSVGAHLVQALGLFEVGAVHLGVVLQLARSLDALVERLSVRRILVETPRLQQVAPVLGQSDHGRSRSRRTVSTSPASRRCHSSPCLGSSGLLKESRGRWWERRETPLRLPACGSQSRAGCSRGPGA